jgi:Protein of unknown function (DUF4011)/AAA domain
MNDDFRKSASAQQGPSLIERLLADARLRLVETGSRNRLVHTPRGGKRTRSLPIIGMDPDGLFDALTHSSRGLRFLPASLERELALEIKAEHENSVAVADGASDGMQANLDEERLEKRLLSIYRDAKTAEEEQGINILFLAIGFLRWYEDDHSEVLREAPLVLLPVSLNRDRRRSTFQLRSRDEDITANQAIQERLRTDFAIALPDLPEGDDWRPSNYFAEVSETISAKSRWSVDPRGIELGFYSFSKLLMIHDLEPAAWGETAIVDHPLLRGLLTDGFADEPFPIESDASLDEHFEPANLVQVVDADSSQTIVIETVREKRNLVVQGPPGTGKSQTIANIIAAAVHDGRSVLFVAEKMAALNVVHQRLQKVGLGPICLQLHSRNANKRLVLAEIEETLNQHSISPDPHPECERLKQVRDTLNAVDRRMHAPVDETGMTPFEALSRLVKAEACGESSDPDLLLEAGAWSKGQYGSIIQAADELSDVTAAAGPRFDHPYFGVQATMLQPGELARLTESLTALGNAAAGLASYTEVIADYLGMQQVASLSLSESLQAILHIIGTIPADAADLADAIATQNVRRIAEASKVGVAWADLRAAHATTYVDAAWDVPAAPLRLGLAAGLSFFGRFKGSYRQASKILATLVNAPLPKSAQERIALVDPLITVESAFKLLRAEEVEMGSMLPSYWRGPQTDFALLHCVSSGLLQLASRPFVLRFDAVIEIARQSLAKEYVSGIKQLSDAYVQAVNTVFPVLKINVSETFNVDERDKIPLRELAAKADTWRENQSRFDEWRRLTAADARLRAHPATALADGLAAGRIAPASVSSLLTCTFAETVWSKAIAANPDLAQFYGPSHNAIVEEFRRLEVNRRTTTVQIIRGLHAEKMPRGGFGEMNIIRAEARRKRGHMPIRKLMKATGRTLQRIKPVFLMSPISVAQFLPPNSAEFDLLVIDEASQVRPEDALGLVVRAEQMVIVGDNKQLPPTSFFDRVITDEEDSDWEEPSDALIPAAKATELESILALCEARGVKSAMLRWHYRSRHPSLIEVSNAEFYRRLIMPPAPIAERGSEGLILRRVAGAYDRGGKRNKFDRSRSRRQRCDRTRSDKPKSVVGCRHLLERAARRDRRSPRDQASQ